MRRLYQEHDGELTVGRRASAMPADHKEPDEIALPETVLKAAKAVMYGVRGASGRMSRADAAVYVTRQPETVKESPWRRRMVVANVTKARVSNGHAVLLPQSAVTAWMTRGEVA